MTSQRKLSVAVSTVGRSRSSQMTLKSVSQPSLSNDAKQVFHLPRDLPKVTGGGGTWV